MKQFKTLCKYLHWKNDTGELSHIPTYIIDAQTGIDCELGGHNFFLEPHESLPQIYNYLPTSDLINLLNHLKFQKLSSDNHTHYFKKWS